MEVSPCGTSIYVWPREGQTDTWRGRALSVSCGVEGEGGSEEEEDGRAGCSQRGSRGLGDSPDLALHTVRRSEGFKPEHLWKEGSMSLGRGP